MKCYDICKVPFRMQVYVDLLNLGNKKQDVLEGRMEGGIFIFL